MNTALGPQRTFEIFCVMRFTKRLVVELDTCDPYSAFVTARARGVEVDDFESTMIAY